MRGSVSGIAAFVLAVGAIAAILALANYDSRIGADSVEKEATPAVLAQELSGVAAKALHSIADLRAYCLVAKSAAEDYKTEHESGDTSIPNFIIFFGTEEKGESNIVVEYAKAIGKAKAKFTGGLGKYNLDLMAQAIISGESVVHTQGTKAALNAKLLGFMETPRYFVNPLGVNLAAYASKAAEVEAQSSSADAAAAAAWLASGSKDAFQSFSAKAHADAAAKVAEYEHSVYMASLKAIKEKYADTEHIHALPLAGIAAGSGVEPVVIPSEDEIEASAKEAAEEWMRKHNEGSEEGAADEIADVAAEAAANATASDADADADEVADEVDSGPQWHLAPGESTACDHGVQATQAECEAAVAMLADEVHATPGRSLQVGSGGTCGDGAWGGVPSGCVAQSLNGGDWAAHFKTSGPNCNNGHYQVVCSGAAKVEDAEDTEPAEELEPVTTTGESEAEVASEEAAATDSDPPSADADDAPAGVFPHNGGVYRIKNLDSKRTINAFSVSGAWSGSMGAGAPEEEEAGGEDTWVTTLQEGGGYRIVNAVSNRALYAQTMDGAWTSGIGAAPAGTPHYADQVWDFIEDPDRPGAYKIKNKHSGRQLFAQDPHNESNGDKFGAGPGSKTYGDNWWSLIPIHS